MPRLAEYWQQLLNEWLKRGALGAVLPEVEALKDCPQSPEYHAEGDALTHTLMAVEAISPTADERVFWGTLLHDIGKVNTTRIVDGNIQSFGHHKVGAKAVFVIMKRMNLLHFADDVAWLVKHHHFALSWGNLKSGGLTKKQHEFCQHDLFPLLIEVARADATSSLGKSTKGSLLDSILSELGWVV